MGGKSDPYVVVNIGAQQFRTRTIHDNLNPVWDFWCEVWNRLQKTILKSQRHVSSDASPHYEEIRFFFEMETLKWRWSIRSLDIYPLKLFEVLF